MAARGETGWQSEKTLEECMRYMLDNDRKCLSEVLNLENVTYVLGQSLLFDDAELRKESLTVIGQNAKAVLTGTAIQFSSRQAMESIIKMDRLPVKEILIYKTCLSWAKKQLQLQRSTKYPTDQELREMLGGMLYQIRFPIMEQTEFAEISEGRNVLTAEEKLSIYYFLATKKEGSQLLFPTQRRFDQEVWIERSISCATGAWRSTPTVDAINFTTDQDVLLTGIGLYTGHNGAGYGVDVEILQSTNSLFKKNLTVPSTGDMNQFKVTLDEPISLRAGILYSVKALSRDTIGHFGSPCQAVCSTEKTTFTFSTHPESHTSTNVNCGQIPRLYFRCLLIK